MANQQGMQPPYIGSKISLISKLDIRYEGTLYTVDPVESTIALAKVHSYGTEGRRTPVFVPPRDEVYDFIIFKASDIKDLIVCEQPKATSPESAAANGLPYDPAIVSISKNPPPEPKLPPRLNMVKGTPVGMGSGRGGILPEKLGSRPSFEQLLGPMRFNYRFPHFQPTPPMLHTRVKRASGSNAVEELKIYDKDYDFEKANEQFREKIIEDLKDDKVEQPKEAKSAIELVASTEEQQEKEADENETAIVLTDEQQRAQQDYYDKKSSFFDNISCDTLEKESGKNVRPDWKRERRTNQETFGSAAVRSLFIQQRGARGGGFIGDRQQMPPAFFNYRYQNYQQPSHNRNYMHRQQQQVAGHRNY